MVQHRRGAQSTLRSSPSRNGAATAAEGDRSAWRRRRVGGSLAGVSPSTPRSRGRLSSREPKPPSERDWERARVLEPRSAPRHPELISDGGGLPFSPSALDGPPGRLDPQDPAVSALVAHLAARAGAKRGSRVPWKRAATPAAPPPSLGDWRLLARSDDEVLFGRGRPPRLLTVALRQGRRSWSHAASNAARPLRAARDGIRASSWRLDPTVELLLDETVLRVLLTEQTFSGGQRADDRVLTPDLYVDDDELVLTLFVTPRPGYQAGSHNPETPLLIALPGPVGTRRLIDGALPVFSAPDAPPATD
jgi:hypothetical protein